MKILFIDKNKDLDRLVQKVSEKFDWQEFLAAYESAFAASVAQKKYIRN